MKLTELKEVVREILLTELVMDKTKGISVSAYKKIGMNVLTVNHLKPV